MLVPAGANEGASLRVGYESVLTAQVSEARARRALANDLEVSESPSLLFHSLVSSHNVFELCSAPSQLPSNTGQQLTMVESLHLVPSLMVISLRTRKVWDKSTSSKDNMMKLVERLMLRRMS